MRLYSVLLWEGYDVWIVVKKCLRIAQKEDFVVFFIYLQ